MAQTEDLQYHLLELRTPLFAVVDGAQFDDLPTALDDRQFLHRSLYRNDSIGGLDRARTAPQLVWLDRKRNSPLAEICRESGFALPESMSRASPELVMELLAWIGERPAAVFWACGERSDALYRHLRTINMVLFPRQGSPERAASATDEEERRHDLVLFRHADANVMAQVLPALDALQFARLFGPATELIFAPDEEWGRPVMRAVRSADLPPAPGGSLKFYPETIDLIETRRLTASRLRRTRYLREACRSETAEASDEAIAEHVRISEESGRELGIVSEAAHARWAFIVCKTNGRVLNSPEARDYITQRGSSPDSQVQQFMRDAMTWMRAQSDSRGTT